MASKSAVSGSSGHSRSKSTAGTPRPGPKKRKADETDGDLDEVDGGDEAGSEVDLANDPGVDHAISVPDSYIINTFRQFIWYIPNKHGAPYSNTTGTTLSMGWYIVPVQFLGYYVKNSDLQFLSAGGRYITIKKVKVTGTNLVATEDQENTSSGALDIVTTPSNQPYLMAYTDHKHLMPIMTAEDPFPSCGSSIPPRQNANLPHAFSTGPVGYWETADADPMNTPFVKFHHANSKGFEYVQTPNLNLPVTAVISDPNAGNFSGCPMHPDGPDKFYELGGSDPPEGLSGHDTLPLDNIAASNPYANRYDMAPIAGIPNYNCMQFNARFGSNDPGGVKSTLCYLSNNNSLMAKKFDERIGPVQQAEMAATGNSQGTIRVDETVTYQDTQFNVQRAPSHIAADAKKMVTIESGGELGRDERDSGVHPIGPVGSGKTIQNKAADVGRYYQEGNHLKNMNYGTALPYQSSMPVMLLKPAPFQTPTGKMHPYSFCVVFSFEAEIEIHRNHTRYNYLHLGVRSSKRNVWAGCNVHSGVKTMPSRNWALG